MSGGKERTLCDLSVDELLSGFSLSVEAALSSDFFSFVLELLNFFYAN